ncbi:Glucosyl transferase GtrII [Pseudobutyrivibrio sp. JW11]|uniref:glucosyltransferase domain-containing protein n=1 Tax=Pseudobutyrivibrio sp. JW11 TaxID=1855302 RepID=UPI0008ED5320|nr:glucosyltransferase domain-containing protein [Pseudobutyrivibrio sp. JW11]SFO34690.1 Glucosyl transferase GtrII [Pseudobutyrivibrio sp. JW11]
MKNITMDHKQIFRQKKPSINFIVCFIVGLIVHLVIIAEGLHNHDSIILTGSDGSWLITQGKWFVTPLMSVDGQYDVPFVSGLIGIACYALSAVFIIEILNVKNSLIQKIIALCVACFPSVGTALIYHAGDYFGGSFLLAVISVFFIISGNVIAIIAGIAVLTLSVGAYQANISVALTLLLMNVLIDLVDQKIAIRKIINKTIVYICSAAFATILYYIILRIIVHVKGIVLSSYKGIDDMGSILSFNVLVNSIKVAYKNYIIYFTQNSLGILSGKKSILGIILIFSLLFIAVIQVKESIYESDILKRKNNIIKSVVLLVYVIVGVPLCANFIGVLSQNTSYYYITICAFGITTIIPLVLIDKINDNQDRVADNSVLKYVLKYFKIFIICITLLIYINWVKEENTVYQEFVLINKEYEAKLPALAERIQSTDGYNQETEIIIVGDAPYDFLKTEGVLQSMENSFYTYGYGLGGGAGEIYASGILQAFFNNNYSIAITFVDDKDQIYENIEKINEMAVYPYDDSIINIDGKIYVKLSDIY